MYPPIRQHVWFTSWTPPLLTLALAADVTIAPEFERSIIEFLNTVDRFKYVFMLDADLKAQFIRFGLQVVSQPFMIDIARSKKSFTPTQIILFFKEKI